jgi:multidrug efflux pump subunit AcrA (membrane-fusion protein)
MPTDAPLLRFMALSAIIGFIFFCGSYAILVWRKRRSPAPGGSLIRRWSVSFIVLGLLGMAITVVVRETVRADGMVGGNNLYAVRASQGMRVIDLAEEGPVTEGSVLARFTSPEALAELRKAELDRELLKKQKERLELDPAPLNRDLVNEHDLALMRMLQLRSTLANLLPSKVGAERDTAIKMIEQRDRLANIENELRVARGESSQASAKLGAARQQLEREQKLARQNTLSTNDLNDRQKEVRSLEAEIAKFDNSIAAIQEKQRQAKESLGQLEKRAVEDGIQLGGELDRTIQELAAARLTTEEAAKKLADDKLIAPLRKQSIIGELDTKLAQADALVAAKKMSLEVIAPYDGMVVYRHSSPSTALNHGPVLVVSPREGLRFLFTLEDSQVESLRNAGPVVVELAETENSVEQRFPATFLSATASTREPGKSLVSLECQVPPGTVAALAEGKPIKARFSWRPPVLNLWPFPVSLFVFGLGMFGLLWTQVSGWKPSWPISKPVAPVGDDEDITVSYAPTPAAKEGDTVEAAFDTIPLHPELLPAAPKETPIPWEHPVGIRLREAIIREDISVELIDAVETAIEQKKGKLIESIREALGRVPTIPDHARRLVDKLNNTDTDDEMKLLERRCLAQRVTFLLYTIGLDLPSHARSGKYNAIDLFDAATRS